MASLGKLQQMTSLPHFLRCVVDAFSPIQKGCKCMRVFVFVNEPLAEGRRKCPLTRESRLYLLVLAGVGVDALLWAQCWRTVRGNTATSSASAMRGNVPHWVQQRSVMLLLLLLLCPRRPLLFCRLTFHRCPRLDPENDALECIFTRAPSAARLA